MLKLALLYLALGILRELRKMIFTKEKNQDIASTILKRQIRELKKGKGRRTLGSEAVHNLRVATRRLRAALKTFKTHFPPHAIELRKELQKLAQFLGKKRDLDVFLAFILKTQHAKRGDFPKLAKQLAKYERQILTIFKSNSFDNLMKDLERLETVKRFNIRIFAKNQIRKVFKKVLELKDDKADDRELHRLRIHLKKLRYTCEFFTPLFPLKACIDSTKEVQDILGEHQDAITGISILKCYQDQFSSEQFKKAKENLKHQEKKSRKTFAKCWKDYCTLAEKTVENL